MKKLLITALMVCIAWGAFAQTVDTSKVDLSMAEMSLAGPDSVYITNIYYGDTRLSALLEYDGATGAIIKELYFDEDKLLLDTFDFGHAELHLVGGDTLIISDMVLYGAGISGRFKFDGMYTLNYDGYWMGEKPVPYDTLLDQLETAQKRYEQELTATKGKYMADVAELEADNDALEAEVAELKAEVASLESDVSSYESQVTALRRQATMAAAGDEAAMLLENRMFSAPVDKSMLDFSMAEMALAGPDSLYVTNLYYGDVRLSVILKYDGMTGATVYGPYYDSDKLLLDSFEMGFADIRVQGENTLIISDLVLYGQGITGRFEYDGRSTLNLKSWWESKTPMSFEARIAELENELRMAKQMHDRDMAATKSKYTADIAELETTLNDLYARIDVGRKDYEDQIAALKRQVEAGGGEVMAPAPTRSVLTASAAARGTSMGGTWEVTAAGATQTDVNQKFAKYAVPLNQSANQTMYSFTARAANATDFVGYGAHIFVSGDKSTLSWGLGNSYLIWVTRDPAFYRNNNTYIQVYRSYDDVTMVQVASVSTSENIARANDIEILYDKAMGEITVSMNGTKYVDYEVADVIRTGSKVAIRTLGGPVTFSNVSIKAK